MLVFLPLSYGDFSFGLKLILANLKSASLLVKLSLSLLYMGSKKNLALNAKLNFGLVLADLSTASYFG